MQFKFLRDYLMDCTHFLPIKNLIETEFLECGLHLNVESLAHHPLS